MVLLRGGVQDIVSHGVNGFLGPDVEEVGRHTLRVFEMGPEEAARMRTQVSGRAGRGGAGRGGADAGKQRGGAGRGGGGWFELPSSAQPVPAS